MHRNAVIGNSRHYRSHLAVALTPVALAIIVATVRAPGVHAQSEPDSENGRFTLQPVQEGILRLDSKTGTVSICTNKAGWACRLVPDERAALDDEIGRLQADNKALKEELARRDAAPAPPVDVPSAKIDVPSAKDDAAKSAEAAPDKKRESHPSLDGERVRALIDRVWARLIEMASEIHKKLSDRS